MKRCKHPTISDWKVDTRCYGVVAENRKCLTCGVVVQSRSIEPNFYVNGQVRVSRKF